VNELGIVNYETIKNCKYYSSDMKVIDCKYIKYEEKEKRYIWKLPKNALLIFDEVHKCKNINTYNADLLLATYNTNIKLLMLSATITDKPENFKIFGYILQFYKQLKFGRKWLLSNDMTSINKQIYPKKGSRMKISDLGDTFPDNQISSDCYTIQEPEKIQECYKKINIALTEHNTVNQDTSNKLTNLLRARQEIELLKIPILVELTNNYRENNLSVVIFINFNKTLQILSQELKTNCIIHGNQTLKEREININNFMTNKERIIICNIESGGQSISLHDIEGGYQRVSLICPSFSSITLLQALGRIHRANSKSPAIQRIIFCANTVEESICNNIKNKIKCLSELNDSDLEKHILSEMIWK
jgi:superfamily II DNA or RNA helicase